MKILTLNKQQQRKLLTLCEEFFPEYKCEFDDAKNWIEIFDSKSIIACIHWYQLCLTELPKRIWDKIVYPYTWSKNPCFMYYEANKGDFGNLQINVAFSVHPVDFLYSFVWECKKHKYFKNATKS